MRLNTSRLMLRSLLLRQLQEEKDTKRWFAAIPERYVFAFVRSAAAYMTSVTSRLLLLIQWVAERRRLRTFPTQLIKSSEALNSLRKTRVQHSSTSESYALPPPQSPRAMMLMKNLDSYGPNPKLIDLPSGYHHIDITLPSSIETPAQLTNTETKRHPAASVNVPTIIFVHGIGSNGTLWYPLISVAGLRERFRIITFDLSGYGLSPMMEQPVEGRLERLGDAIGEVLDYAGAQETFLVAHSFGTVS